jgi:hypothetical protein
MSVLFDQRNACFVIVSMLDLCLSCLIRGTHVSWLSQGWLMSVLFDQRNTCFVIVSRLTYVCLVWSEERMYRDCLKVDLCLSCLIRGTHVSWLSQGWLMSVLFDQRNACFVIVSRLTYVCLVWSEEHMFRDCLKVDLCLSCLIRGTQVSWLSQGWLMSVLFDQRNACFVIVSRLTYVCLVWSEERMFRDCLKVDLCLSCLIIDTFSLAIGEGYSRNASVALNLISTFLLISLGRYLYWWTINIGGHHPPSSQWHWHSLYDILFCRNLQFLNHVIIIKAEVLLPQA